MEQNIQVFIDDFQVDISTTSSIKIKKQLTDVKELSKKKTSFSKPISVLFTNNNHNLFKNAFNINEVGGWDKNSRPNARIVVNSETVLTGLMKLSSITQSAYAVVVYADNVNLESLFSDEVIRGNSDSSKDISFTNKYQFNLTRPNLRALMQSVPRHDGKGINYAYADLVGDANYEADRLFIPSIAVRELLEETLESVGKTLTVSAGIEKYLNKLYMPFNSEYKELTNAWQYAKYASSQQAITRKAIWFDLKLIEALDCSYDKIQDIPTDTGSNRYYIDLRNNVGEYKISFTCSVKKETDKGEAPEVMPSIYLHTTKVYPYITTELELTNTGSDPDAGIVLSGAGYHEATFEATFKLLGGETSAWIGFTNTELPNDEGQILCNPDGSTHIEITKLDSFYNEDVPNVIESDKILPTDYKKVDLFNDVVLFFNAISTIDGDNIHLQTANEFNVNRNPNIKDWSEKIHEDEIDLSTLYAKKAEITEFEFADGDDLYNDDYITKYDSGIVDYSRVEDNKTVVTKSLNISNTVRIDNFSALLNNDAEYNTKLKPRFLFINYLDSSVYTDFGLDKEGVRDRSIEYLHILSNRYSEDTAATDNVFIGFRNDDNYSDSEFKRVDTDGTLYNVFHKSNELLTTNDDLIFLNSKFNLTPKDFAEIEFNDIIFVNTKKHGGAYYRLNEITSYEAGTSNPSDVELIQIDLELLDNLDFSASEIDTNQVTLTAAGEEIKDQFQAISGGGGSSSGITYEEVQTLIDQGLSTKLDLYGTAVDSDKLGGELPSFYATVTALANGLSTKLGVNDTAADSNKLNGQLASYYLNASNINSGTLSDSFLSSNVALKNINNNFSTLQNIVGGLAIAGTTVIDDSRNFTGGSGTFSGNIRTPSLLASPNIDKSRLVITATDTYSSIQGDYGSTGTKDLYINTSGGIVNLANKLETTSTGTETTGNSIVSGSGSFGDILKEIGTFTGGFGGDKWQLNPNDSGLSHLTIDRLTVRDRMDIYELIVNQIRATNGSLWVSDAVKIESVSGSTLYVNDDTDITFQANDIIKAQQFDGRNIRTYTAKVATVGATSFTVTTEVGTAWAGMELVRIGNATNADRQGALYLTSSDSNAPYLDVLDGVTSTSLAEKTKVRLGRLDGITDAELGTLTGYGLYGDNVFLKGKMLLSPGSSISFSDVTNAESEVTTITNNTVTSAYVNALDISASAITTGTLDAARIATGSLNADKITSGTITSTQINATSIAAATVTASNINALSLTSTQGFIGGWIIGTNTISGGNLVLNSNGTISNSTKYSLNNDGSGQFASSNFEWDTSGNILMQGTIKSFDGAFQLDPSNNVINLISGGTSGNGIIKFSAGVVDPNDPTQIITGLQIATLNTNGNNLEIECSNDIKLMAGPGYSNDLYVGASKVAEFSGTQSILSSDLTVTGKINGMKTIHGSFYSDTDGNQSVSIAGLTNVRTVIAHMNDGLTNPINIGCPSSGNTITVNRDDAHSNGTIYYVAYGW